MVFKLLSGHDFVTETATYKVQRGITKKTYIYTRAMVLAICTLSNIGIKHDFLCINICLAPREALKPEPERRGFQHLPRGPADVLNVSEKPVWSLLLHTAFFSLENFGEIASKSSSYLWRGTLKHVTCERFQKSASRAKTNIIATMHFTDDDVCFYDGPGMLIHKTAKPCMNSTWIAFKLLIHEFVPVKTWLLIACDTGFYAIMLVNISMTFYEDILNGFQVTERTALYSVLGKANFVSSRGITSSRPQSVTKSRFLYTHFDKLS